METRVICSRQLIDESWEVSRQLSGSMPLTPGDDFTINIFVRQDSLEFLLNDQYSYIANSTICTPNDPFHASEFVRFSIAGSTGVANVSYVNLISGC
jgi:hypothetical protein